MNHSYAGLMLRKTGGGVKFIPPLPNNLVRRLRPRVVLLRIGRVRLRPRMLASTDTREFVSNFRGLSCN